MIDYLFVFLAGVGVGGMISTWMDSDDGLVPYCTECIKEKIEDEES